MAIREEEANEYGWHHQGPDGGLYRWEEVGPSEDVLAAPQPVNDGTGITTTSSLRSAVGTMRCERCERPIRVTDSPTPGQRIGMMLCGGCSAALGRHQLVSRSKRAVGRPRKVERS